MGIAVYQQDGQCIQANNASANIIGANSENQLLQQNIYKIKSWEKSGLTELFTKCKTEDKTVNDIIKIKTSFDKTIWIDLSFIPINYKNKKHVMAMYADITERKKGELKLKTLSLAVESAPASIIITDPNSKIEYVNKMFEEVTGYKSDEVIGKNPRLLSSNTHSKIFYKNLWDTILTGKTWKGEFLNKRKDGGTYYESAMISSVHDNDGNITNFVAVKEDITEFKAAQKEFGFDDYPLLVADTVVTSQNQILRKAKCVDDARNILMTQSGNITSIVTCMIYHSKDKKIIDISQTDYIFDEFKLDDLDSYLQSGEWRGKAGACMVEGFCKSYIKEVRGFESTAMGLNTEVLKAFI
jgi:septum formation protein